MLVPSSSSSLPSLISPNICTQQHPSISSSSISSPLSAPQSSLHAPSLTDTQLLHSDSTSNYYNAIPPSPFTSSTTLLDLPSEVLLRISQHLDQSSLAHLASTCRPLYYIAVPPLWRTVSLDLTASATSRDSHAFDSVRSATLLTSLAHGSVSQYPLECVHKVALNINTLTTHDLMTFIGARFLRPAVLRNIREIEITGASWTNIEAVKQVLLAPFKETVQISIYDISLSCLVELALPVGPLNCMLAGLSIQFSSHSNTSSDLVLLSNTLALLPSLASFGLSFNPDFDLCDDPGLESYITHLFLGLRNCNRLIKKVALFDFPPYLEFNPSCLPSSITDFTFHTNLVDSEDAFFAGILQCSHLTSLSVRIASSSSEYVDSSSFPAPHSIQLRNLRELTLDTPSAPSLLPAIVSANQGTLSHLSVSNMSTSLLISSLLKLRGSLRSLYVYSLASSAAPDCSLLVLTSALKCFHKLRTLSLPVSDVQQLQACTALKYRSPSSSPVSVILSLPFAYLSTSPVQHTPSLDSCKVLSGSRAALWSALAFSSVDDLELYYFHNEGRSLVLSS